MIHSPETRIRLDCFCLALSLSFFGSFVLSQLPLSSFLLRADSDAPHSSIAYAAHNMMRDRGHPRERRFTCFVFPGVFLHSALSVLVSFQECLLVLSIFVLYFY